MRGILAMFALLLAVQTAASATELPDTLMVVLDSAKQQDLPAEILEQKALEGLAKGVREDRIAYVIVDLLDQWQGAEKVLGERAKAADRADLIPAAASAMHLGAPPDAVVGLSDGTRGAQSLWALSDVLYAGVPAEDAERLVRAALASRQPDLALRELPEAARLLVAEEGPAGAATEITRVLAEGHTPLAAVTNAGPGRSGDHSKAGGNGNGNAVGEGKSGGKAP